MSHEVMIDSSNRFNGKYNFTSPENTASYTLVYNIGLELIRPMTYPPTSRFMCDTVAHW